MIAKLRFARITPRKMRLVANLCKGKSVNEAQDQLKYCQKRGGRILQKLLKSAASNAQEKMGVAVDNLRVKQVLVDQGPILKRFIPRSMGRATPIRKDMSHITVILQEVR